MRAKTGIDLTTVVLLATSATTVVLLLGCLSSLTSVSSLLRSKAVTEEVGFE